MSHLRIVHSNVKNKKHLDSYLARMVIDTRDLYPKPYKYRTEREKIDFMLETEELI